MAVYYVVLYALLVLFGVVCAFAGYRNLEFVAIGVIVFGYLALAAFASMNVFATLGLLLAVLVAIGIVFKYVQLRHVAVLQIMGKAMLNMATIILVGTSILSYVVDRYAAYIIFILYITLDVYIGMRYTERIRLISITACLGGAIIIAAVGGLWLDNVESFMDYAWLKVLFVIVISLIGSAVQIKWSKEPSLPPVVGRHSMTSTQISDVATPRAMQQWVSVPYTELPAINEHEHDDHVTLSVKRQEL